MPLIDRICEHCDKTFKIQRWRLKNKKRGKFCSINCNNKYHSGENSHLFGRDVSGDKSSSWKGGKPNCIECGKSITYKAKRCRSCNLHFHSGENHYLYGKKRPKLTGKNHPSYKGGYERKLMNNRKRRIVKIGNGGSHTLKEWELLKDFYGHMCLCCKKIEPEIVLSEDHIVPLYKGGSDNIENIQPLCRSCNSKKGINSTNYVDIIKEVHFAKL